MHIDMQTPPTQPSLTQPASCPPFLVFYSSHLAKTPTKNVNKMIKSGVLAASLRGYHRHTHPEWSFKAWKKGLGEEGGQENQPV